MNDEEMVFDLIGVDPPIPSLRSRHGRPCPARRDFILHLPEPPEAHCCLKIVPLLLWPLWPGNEAALDRRPGAAELGGRGRSSAARFPP